MRIIHGVNYTIDERKKYKPLIFLNIIDSINRMVNAMKQFNLKFALDNNEDNYQIVLDCHKDLIESKFDWRQSLERYSSIIRSIWDDPSVRTVYQRRNEFYLIDSIELYKYYIYTYIICIYIYLKYFFKLYYKFKTNLLK